jgi:alpha-D-xyloside xylohydrolase
MSFCVLRASRNAIALVLVLGSALCSSLALAASPPLMDRNGSFVNVEPYAPNIVRITISSDKDLALAPPGYGFIAKPDDQGWQHTSAQGADVFQSNRLKVEVVAQPYPGPPSQMERYFAPSLPPIGVRINKGNGEPLVAMSGWEMAPHVVNGEKTFRVGASFSATSDEHFYGLGQNQEGILDHRGRTIDCRHYYDAPHGEQVCVPFLVTNKGYGIVWDNPSATTVTPGLAGKTVWHSEVGERVSYFVIAGDSTDEIYAGYRLVSGPTPLPPKPAFGYMQSKARYETQQQVLDVAKGYRTRGYPLDVLIVDWFYWTRMGQLDINPVDFPDPAAMNRELHDEGIHSMISVWPRFEKESRNFNTLAAKGWLLADKEGKPVDGLAVRSDRAGALLDSTNPQAREWFWGQIRDNIAAKGFDWFWLDETEPDLVPDGYFYSIGSGDRYHNLYPLVHTQGIAEGSRRDRPTKRNVILARAAYIGAQRNGALFWSSDIDPSWDALQRQIPTGLNVSASGITYWGNDIGGWQPLPASSNPAHAPLLDGSDARDVIGGYSDYPELITRWYQYATFTPTMRAHGLRKSTEVWAYGKQAEAVIAQYLKLRYQLIPYLYSLGKRTYDTGAPIMRPLFMDFPADAQVVGIGDEYMFGPAFLVAPVTQQGAQSRSVYLPAGSDWYDFWTNQKIKGGQTINTAAPIDRIPLFVRAGSIVPIGIDVSSTATAQPLKEIRVYPGRDASFALFDDDGLTYDYERGKGNTTLLSWTDGKAELSAKGSLKAESARKLLMVVH